jgi:hypothetical protein
MGSIIRHYMCGRMRKEPPPLFANRVEAKQLVLPLVHSDFFTSKFRTPTNPDFEGWEKTTWSVVHSTEQKSKFQIPKFSVRPAWGVWGVQTN